MDLRVEFKIDPQPNVTAAQIGINKWDWVSVEGYDEEVAKSIMQDKKFDIIPIKNPEGQFHQYYSTRLWQDYTALNLNKITDSNTIYYSTDLRDLIKRFNVDKKHYYFLSDYTEIVGLVSYANLSCQAVYNYLYFIISSIEIGVSEFLKSRIEENLVIEVFESRSGENHYSQTLKRYLADNKEYSIFSYLDFKDLGLIAHRSEKMLLGKEKALLKYHKKFENSYNDLRLKVMHPVKTLLTTHESVLQIDELFDDYIHIMNIIKD